MLNFTNVELTDMVLAYGAVGRVATRSKRKYCTGTTGNNIQTGLYLSQKCLLPRYNGCEKQGSSIQERKIVAAGG
jgi:hypothetical protein